MWWWIPTARGSGGSQPPEHCPLPQWSPDGRKMAFSSFQERKQRIYELDLVTGRSGCWSPTAPDST